MSLALQSNNFTLSHALGDRLNCSTILSNRSMLPVQAIGNSTLSPNYRKNDINHNVNNISSYIIVQ